MDYWPTSRKETEKDQEDQLMIGKTILKIAGED